MPRKKLIRFEETKKMENVVNEPEKYRGKWSKMLGGKPIVLELGCGSGDYTISLGRMEPEMNFIGIDRQGERVWLGAKKATELGLSNVCFMRVHIEKLSEYFAEGEVSEIWVTFPDPYPKPSKSGRRLSSTRFLEIYKSILKDGGIVHLKTDDEALFDFSVESAREFGAKILKEVKDLYGIPDHKTGPESEIQTYYEKRFIAEGKRINYLKINF